MLYGYRYDQLNRIVGMNAYRGFDNQTNTISPIATNEYAERISYDPNGNILTYKRNGTTAAYGSPATAHPLAMDDLEYNYDAASNRLNHVDDNTLLSNNFNEDIDDQNPNNYTYDKIGNLIKDGLSTDAEHSSITWTVYGKIQSITKTKNAITTITNYTYDAGGNRISKTANGKITVYVRDATGNVMSIYEAASSSAPIIQTEIDLYGSSRLGMIRNPSVPADITMAAGFGKLTTFTRGQKLFELSNHLGNVLVTVTDKKIPVANTGSTEIAYYTADVATATDYYPFGMAMPGRSYSAENAYRYGFNGQEKSDEIFEGSTTALFWEYDSRIGRRWNIDPEVKENESPYVCFSANPIFFSDALGNQPGNSKSKEKKPEIVNLTANQISDAAFSAINSIHTNTIYNRGYYVYPTTPENKRAYLPVDLYDDVSAKLLTNLFGVKPSQMFDFVDIYKYYYNQFATIGMWYDGSKTIKELYKAMQLVSPDKRAGLADQLISDFNAKNEKWQQLSQAGVTFGNILLMYGGQQIKVGNGIKAPNIIIGSKPNLVKALSAVGGSKAASEFLGWGKGTKILKTAADFTKAQLIKAGYTHQVLTDIAAGLREAAKKTLKASSGELNPASISRAEQVEQIIKTHF